MKSHEEIDLATYRRLTAAVPRKRAKRAPRADIPRAEPSERDGLTTVLKAGWSVQSLDAVRYRLYQINRPGMDTGMQVSAAEAVKEAKRLMREAGE